MRAFGNPKTMIIVTGGPGTGKSYGAAKIEEEFEGLKKLSYDEIKEKNWDIFGFDNKEQKEALNKFGLEEFICMCKNPCGIQSLFPWNTHFISTTGRVFLNWRRSMATM